MSKYNEYQEGIVTIEKNKTIKKLMTELGLF